MNPTMASLGFMSHPNCSVPAMEFAPTEDRKGAVPLPEVAADLRAEFVTMVRLHEEFTPRKQQAHLGPSDLGAECDRKLAYKIAGVKGNNTGDPWPAAVGTAIHHFLEDVVTQYAAEYGGAWMVEQRVVVDPLVRGSADLVRSPIVADIKSAGKDMMDKVRKNGPPDSYKTQINLYAKGLNDSGVKIDTVAFIFVPRSGWLEDMYVWAAPYDPDLAAKALTRPYTLADSLNRLDIRNNPGRWNDIPATPSYLCTWCPLYDKHRTQAEGADDRGCPGANK